MWDFRDIGHQPLRNMQGNRYANGAVRRTTFLTRATDRKSANIDDMAAKFGREQRHAVMSERMGPRQSQRPSQSQSYTVHYSGPSTSLADMRRSVLPATSSHSRAVEPQNTLPGPQRISQLSSTVLVTIGVRPLAFKPVSDGTNFAGSVGNLYLHQPSDSTLRGMYLFVR
jgi:hypothetical protein